MTLEVPSKLKVDSIAEAVCEIRFETENMPEIVVGALASIPLWSGYKPARSPVADIPMPVRLSDENLKYQPLMEMRSPDNLRTVRIGSNVFAYINSDKYLGWGVFFKEIQQSLEEVYSRVSFKISRVGLRYINTLSEKQYINSIKDMNLTIKASNNDICDHVNLNYAKKYKDNFEVMVRISSPEFIQTTDRTIKLLVDLDIATISPSKIGDIYSLIAWINEAHDLEKTEFFGLFKPEVLQRNIEK